MIKVEFLGPIGLNPIELNVKTVEELSESLKKISAMDQWIGISAIAINDKMVTNSEDCMLSDGDVVSVLPPVCGG
ncbi:MAG: molybdopterin synthase sulfur carrier subunit [Sulfurovum sp.]|nr:MAG: molybdopterin synthase sulfur carrier subunit [Sulfurovum sp.]